jgi:hypothetical protein
MKKIQITAALAFALFAASPAAAASVDAPTCYKVSRHKCMVTFNSISENNANLVFLRLTVDSNVVSQSTAFFTPSVIVSGDRFGAGFPVACGKLGESGDADMGLMHQLRIDPLDANSNSLGTSIANVYCPGR